MPSASMGERLPRLAFLQLRGLDHFLPDLVAGLAATGAVEPRRFTVTGPEALAEALRWADDPARDALWFEFCWPPFPELLARTDFGERRVILRVHRIEAYEAPHAARCPWDRVTDCVTVSEDMARILLQAAPTLERTTRLHVLHNGVDLDRFAPAAAPPDPFRIGWCGSMIARKNPTLALEILARLLAEDPRWRLHIASGQGDRLVQDAVLRLVPRMGLGGAVRFDGAVPAAAMPAWHARNAVLLSTSLHESFGYAIAEAAAVGCDLAVLDHRGAEEFWPEAARFGTVEEAARMIRAARPGRWRGLVAERFGLDRQVAAVLALLRDRAPPAPRERLVPLSHGAWRGVFPLRDPADQIQHAILATGAFYESAMLEDLRQRLPPGGLFVDVGANIGNHTLFAAGVCGARVLAFEPAPALAEHCAATLASNGLAGALDLRRQGAAAAPGAARLLPGPAGNAGETALEPDAAGEVALVRLDDAVGEAPDAIKIDVEGMECAVLEGARGLLARHRPALYVETRTEPEFAAVAALLRPLGYRAEARFNHTPTWLFLPER
ncbi:FkbM family methyltransferase [Paracraurococcus lichenis]|uniref:FkbM family methyltransferase n=1 Tax=Paracraurococcus lichenis TaxID=3064888 RepID=A0ABT9DY34_9PROT|nr:FkbM family methyltransferase [Paracraurococcus sp. LOR1-02]MDO9708806.1 FkbM family methyltransferase [Paracraurococcus sp. LOR1-02]